MPSQRYERIPLNFPSLERLDDMSSYNSGLPNTAPPSFHSVEHPSSNLPQGSGGRATPMLLLNQHPNESTQAFRDRSETEGDDGISLWGATSSSTATSRDFMAARDGTVLQLMKRVEDLEMRLDTQESSKKGNGDVDIEALEIRPRREWNVDDRGNAIAVSLGVILFLVSFWTFYVLGVRARHSRT